MSFIVSYEKMCCCEGGFGGNVEHDPHILYTLSAVQVLSLFDKLDVIDVDKVTSCILTHILPRFEGPVICINTYFVLQKKLCYFCNFLNYRSSVFFIRICSFSWQYTLML